MLATVKLSKWWLQLNRPRTTNSVASLLAANPIEKIMIGTTSSGISDQWKYIYSICRCCWNVATYHWKVHNGKMKFHRLTRKTVVYEWLVTWSHAISHPDHLLLHGSLRVIQLQVIFKVCNISNLCVYYFIVITYLYVIRTFLHVW